MRPWQHVLKESFNSKRNLFSFLGLPPPEENPSFSFLVPFRIAEKMDRTNLFEDPLFLQYVGVAPPTTETNTRTDPVEDASFCREAKLLHKYNSRVLLLTTSACAMHCRYCFRQNFPYKKGGDYEKELAYIAADPSIQEVILSGGDPLSLPDMRLGALLQALASIDHVKIIRFHTRFIMGIPERIDAPFLALLEKCPKQIVFVLHINHAQELDADIVAAIRRLQRIGIPILSQSVLLRGVNDSFSTLKSLAFTLASIGVIPYYLHRLDRVSGSAHYDVPTEEGVSLIEQLRSALPGWALFRYVQEVPHDSSKIPITF